ncbi:MAG: hypothetical protein JF593_12025 [Novosphingobium sp.]|nr:hypothetical protein [Novosphingobium sp.]
MGGKRPVLAALVLVLVLAGSAGPLWAQDAPPDARLRKLEAEVRALQRQVFPDGEPRFFPQNVPPPAQNAPAGTPASAPVTDLLARIDGLEAQLARLTAQNEDNTNRLHQLEARFASAAPASGAAAPAAAEGAPEHSAASANLSAMTGGTARSRAPGEAARVTPAAAAVVPVEVPAQRLAAVRAIEKPQTGDAAEDSYSYGYRLWDAKLYPEAEQQLKLFLDKYPRHSRASYARNLLGRSLLDEGKARDAAPWFLQNYQSDKRGARAPDSLLNLAEAMAEIKDSNRACIALDEFAKTYAAEAAGRLRPQLQGTRAKVKCD